METNHERKSQSFNHLYYRRNALCNIARLSDGFGSLMASYGSTSSPADEPVHIPEYSSFLIRLWQDTPDGPWSASAQSVQSGEVVRFASLQELFVFLEAQTASCQQDKDGSAGKALIEP
ncbi:MAG: hypothetical protein AAF702_00345 [Chloroflexota bacterium]